MAIALLPEQTETRQAPPATATVLTLCSPIRSANGTWRTLRREVAAGQCLAATLPARVALDRIIVNGGVIVPDAYTTTDLQAGDEVLIVPTWGYEAVAAVIAYVGWQTIAAVAVSAAVSIAATALTYILFPPQKPHNIQHRPEEPSFSFEGIRTAIGPGAPVPVIYGRQRVGGQLLSTSVDQAQTVVDGVDPPRRLRALAAPATLTMLLAIGEGPVAALDPATIQINGQPFSNFPGIEVYTAMGTTPQVPLPYFGETRATFADGRDIPEFETTMTYTTTQPVQSFVLNIVFNRGLYAFNPKGEKVDNFVDLRYRYTPVGSPFVENWSHFIVVANRTSVVRFAIRQDSLPLSLYNIQLQMTNVQSVTNAEWQPSLESVTEIQQGYYGYPDTALVGLRAIATDALQGALPNVTIEVLGRTVRVGSFSATPEWSDNPAWCVLDFMTNVRYGLGIPDAEIDLGAFQVWAQYCDQIIAGEKRHTFNYTLDRDMRAQPALLEMTGGSRVLMMKSEGLWTPRPTRDDPPVQLLSWANCTNLALTYTRDSDRVNVIEARFANEEQDFEQDVLAWPPVESWPLEVHKTSLEIRGVTKPSRIMRAMQFELNRRRLENLRMEITCSLDAIVLQPHDLFRFSHPLPGWGTSGRVQAGSTSTFLYLDTPVTFSGLHSYVVYVRHEDGTTEVRPVSYPGDVQMHTLTLVGALSQAPAPRTSLWAFGYLLPPVDTAVKVFRVLRIERQSDTTIRLQAIIHNPSLYDEADALPLPVISSLFNPLGPPPPLTSLVLTEATRIQASGASLRVVNLSWDVAGLGPGYAPYGGALILRRSVQASALAGSGVLGQAQAAEIRNVEDGTVNFAPLAQVSGHVLDVDDYTVVTGQTYIYRVVPVSHTGVPNNVGALEGIIHVAGPTTPGFFPGTVQNLRLRGQPPTATLFEGRDVHLEWDAVATSPLFTETFFVQDYVLEVWAPGQVYLLRRVIVGIASPGAGAQWTYTLEQNIEDHLHAGQAGARRDLSFYVWARTNTGRLSLDPAILTVTNPPPDMSNILPTTVPLFNAGLIAWDQFAEPRDFDHYQVFLDTVNPPLAVYQDIAIAFSGQGTNFRKIFPSNLVADTTYYLYVLPFDTFGPGIPSQIVTFVPSLIVTENIADAAIQADLIAAGAVTTTKIADDAISTPKLLAGSVTTPKIAAQTIIAGHLVTDVAVITTAAQIANALIYDAHIINLAVDKLLAGTLNVLVSIGVGATGGVFLDGPNRAISIFDNAGVRRMLLGRQGSIGAEFGLQMWNALGQLMWDIDTGAQSVGIIDGAITADKIAVNAIVAGKIAANAITAGNIVADSITTNKLNAGAVTTPKIAPAAVTESTSYFSATGTVNIVTETVCATITFPTLLDGDVVLFTFTGTASESDGPNLVRVLLRHDNLTGTIIAGINEDAPGGAACISFQSIYGVTATLTSKTFVYTLERNVGVGLVSIGSITITAVRLQR